MSSKIKKRKKEKNDKNIFQSLHLPVIIPRLIQEGFFRTLFLRFSNNNITAMIESIIIMSNHQYDNNN